VLIPGLAVQEKRDNQQDNEQGVFGGTQSEMIQ
jgi:hypothetical protein